MNDLISSVSELQSLEKYSRVFISQQNRVNIYIQRTKFHTTWAMNDLISSVSELQSLDKYSRVFISQQNRVNIYIQRTKFHTTWAMNDLISSQNCNRWTKIHAFSYHSKIDAILTFHEQNFKQLGP
ncbi:hypothetical protein BKA69DRAFT_1171311 [Paraphysoderma sedebokerense]|nr:hypothetical protein BKA69DRAFT_1171311 [Paraphysoderma sedebokerense]